MIFAAMDIRLVPFIVFGVAFVALVAWFVAKGRARAAARARTLAALGFAAAPSEAAALSAAVAQAENNSDDNYRVVEPMRASVHGKPVWFYVKERSQQGSVVSAYELRFPLHRPSTEGVVLFYKPTDLASGTTATLIGDLATDGFDSQPDDLTRLEIPVDRKKGNLIGALGPAHRSLYDLIDADALDVLEPVGDFGALVVICRDDGCSVASSTTRTNFDLARLWPIVERLMAS
jgi:hypothetical protein